MWTGSGECGEGKHGEGEYRGGSRGQEGEHGERECEDGNGECEDWEGKYGGWEGDIVMGGMGKCPVVCFQVGDERDGKRMWLANASVVEKHTSLSRLERDPKGEHE